MHSELIESLRTCQILLLDKDSLLSGKLIYNLQCICQASVLLNKAKFCKTSFLWNWLLQRNNRYKCSLEASFFGFRNTLSFNGNKCRFPPKKMTAHFARSELMPAKSLRQIGQIVRWAESQLLRRQSSILENNNIITRRCDPPFLVRTGGGCPRFSKN